TWRVQMKRGRQPPPFFPTGEVSLSFLAGLLLPALGFLRHCLLSPPSLGFACGSARGLAGGCRLARSLGSGALRPTAPSGNHQSPSGAEHGRVRALLEPRTLTRNGLSLPPSYQM